MKDVYTLWVGIMTGFVLTLSLGKFEYVQAQEEVVWLQGVIAAKDSTIADLRSVMSPDTIRLVVGNTQLNCFLVDR